MCKTPDFGPEAGGLGSWCPVDTAPASMDPELTRSYAACDSFCVVRHPLDRFLATFRQLGGKGSLRCGTGDLKRLRTFMYENFVDVKQFRYMNDCQFIPQVEHVLSQGGKTRICKHVLRYENLTQEFGALMRAYNEKAIIKQGFPARDTCRDRVPPDVLATVWSYYARDYEALGYAPPEGVEAEWRRVAPRAGRCLAFLHVPKNAGTSIEHEFWMEELSGPYDGESPLRRRGVRDWGKFDKRLRCLKEMKCFSGPCCLFGYHDCSKPNTKEEARCSAWHTPPTWDPVLKKSYEGCDTFCVVRNPISKMRSKWS